MKIRIVAVLVLLNWLTSYSFGQSCEKLAILTFSDAKITTAQLVPAGSFLPPADQRKALEAYRALPEFCRVAATLTPTGDSDIKIEVWLPISGWNGKFQAVGNGGWAGIISYPALADAVKAGYAGASTDTGHVGSSGSFALNHPDKLADFSWRSEHEMAVKAKALIQSFYGTAPRRSYWNGCSTGGRQGLMEAQKFPDDFDGIVAGAPANRTPIGLWIAFAVLKDKDSYIPASKYPMIHRAALDACDTLDGLKDGLIGNPPACNFDPRALLCREADSPDCLTAPQVEAARKIYTPGTNPRTGQEIFPSLARGSELGWGSHGGGPEPTALTLDQFRYIVFKDPSWDWRTFNFDSDYARFALPENLPMNATDPDLTRFFSRDGKLLIYHGWSDAMVSPFATVIYYRSVLERMGGAAKNAGNIRLFLAPGMGHCGGGDGPNAFDAIGSLDQWVEKGKAPERIEASESRDGKVVRTRPLCPYPQEAVYSGNGSVNEASAFVCKAP